MILDVPQPYWVVIFSAMIGAAVTATVQHIRSDRQAVSDAQQIAGPESKAPSVAVAKGIVGTNKALQAAVESLQVCNGALQQELDLLKAQFATAQAEAKLNLDAALARIKKLEGLLDDALTVRDIKRRRVALANEDRASVR